MASLGEGGPRSAQTCCLASARNRRLPIVAAARWLRGFSLRLRKPRRLACKPGAVAPVDSPCAATCPSCRPHRIHHAAEADVPCSYIVQPGDSAWDLASRYGLTSEEVQAANPDVPDLAYIRAGDLLSLPVRRGRLRLAEGPLAMGHHSRDPTLRAPPPPTPHPCTLPRSAPSMPPQPIRCSTCWPTAPTPSCSSPPPWPPALTLSRPSTVRGQGAGRQLCMRSRTVEQPRAAAPSPLSR